jgi:hypothetical protein
VNTNRFTFCVLVAALICLVGCVAPKATETPNPLTGFHVDSSAGVAKAITDDYQDYIHKLPPAEQFYVQGGSTWFFKDDTGQHAVKISIPLNGTWWAHVLIYDKNNVRIKAVKYADGRYAS